jgi:hypothetical protein
MSISVCFLSLRASDRDMSLAQLIISVFLETSEDRRGAYAGSQCQPYHHPVNI